MNDTTGTAVSLSGVGVVYAGSAAAVLSEVTCTIQQGQFVTMVGPSGCGKSTLLRLIAGLIAPTTGTIRVAGNGNPAASVGTDQTSESELSESPRFGFVFQHPTLLPWRTAAQNLRLPLELGTRSHRDSFNTHSSSQAFDVNALLQRVGLSPEDAGKRPAALSGGMQMRLSLARALSLNPSILLLDEPFAAVDDLLRLRLQEDVHRIHRRQHLTTILVTHNIQEAAMMSDRVLVMSGRPASITRDVRVDGPETRSAAFRNTPQFAECVRSVTAALYDTADESDCNNS